MKTTTTLRYNDTTILKLKVAEKFVPLVTLVAFPYIVDRLTCSSGGVAESSRRRRRYR